MIKFSKSKSINRKMFLVNQPAIKIEPIEKTIIAKRSLCEPLEPIEKMIIAKRSLCEPLEPIEKTLNIINDKEDNGRPAQSPLRRLGFASHPTQTSTHFENAYSF